MSFYFQPRLLTPRNPESGTWSQIMDLCTNGPGLRVDGFKSPAELSYFYERYAPLGVGLRPHQKTALNFIRRQEKRGDTPRALPTNFSSSDTQHLPGSFEKGLLDYFGQAGDLHSQLLELGLAWALDLSLENPPRINLDEMDFYLEQLHKDPETQFTRLGQIKDKVKRSRLGFFFSRWMLLRRTADMDFAIDVSHQTGLTGSDWSHLDLKEWIADSTDLSHADISFSAAQQASIVASSARNLVAVGANLQDASLIDSHFTGASFCYANLTHAHAKGADFREADLSMAQLTDLSIRGANLSDITLVGDRSQPPLIHHMIITGEQKVRYLNAIHWVDETRYTRWDRARVEWQQFQQCFFEKSQFQGTRFKDVTFNSCQFNEAVFENCEFEDCLFSQCSFKGVDIDKLLACHIKGQVILNRPKNLKPSDMIRLKRAGFLIQVRDQKAA